MVDSTIGNLTKVVSGNITEVTSALLAIVNNGTTEHIDLDVLAGLIGGGGGEYAQARKTVNQLINNNTWTNITFNVEDNDPGGFFNPSSSHMFFIPNNNFSEARIWLYGTWAANATGGRYLRINNSAGTALVNAIKEAENESGQMIATRRLAISSGDLFAFQMLQNRGGTLDVSGTQFGGNSYAYMELYV